MLKVITPLVVFLSPFAVCFNGPVFDTWQVLVLAWIVCLGRRTISRVWQTTGRAESENYSKAYRCFNQAIWNWDDIARVCSSSFFAISSPDLPSDSLSMTPYVTNGVPRLPSGACLSTPF